MGYNAAVAKLFADIPAFSASVETLLTNKADKSRLTIPMRMFKREDKLRIETDFARIRGVGFPLESLTAMQNIGMARVTTIVDPKDKGMLVVFPELKAYTRVALAETDLPDADVKVTKRRGSKDTVDGQACVRQRVTLASANGQKVEATTWEATALNSFPIRMVFEQDDGTMEMRYTDVQLKAPAEDQFKVPSEFRSFESVTAVMQEAMAQVRKRAGQ